MSITDVIAKARAAQEAHELRIPVQLSLEQAENPSLTNASRDGSFPDATHEVAPGHPVKPRTGNEPRR